MRGKGLPRASLERNELLDESIDAMITMWSEEDVTLRGYHFQALGQTQRPGPVQRPHPPLVIGGNSRASRQRVARRGQGWAPILMGETAARTNRTRPLTSPQELRLAVDDLEVLLDEEGRSVADVDVLVAWPPTMVATPPYDVTMDALAELGDAGATSVLVELPAEDVGATLDLVAAYGAEVIAAPS